MSAHGDGVDSERKHLEGLLKDRINFHLVFSSLFLLGSFQLPTSDPDLRVWVLLTGTVVSVLMTLAIVRSTRLVNESLKRLPEAHSLDSLKNSICKFPGNANMYLVAVPLVLTTLFGFLSYGEANRVGWISPFWSYDCE